MLRLQQLKHKQSRNSKQRRQNKRKSYEVAKQSLKNAQRCNLKGCTVGQTLRSKKIIRDVIEVQHNEKTRDAKIQHT